MQSSDIGFLILGNKLSTGVLNLQKAKPFFQKSLLFVSMFYVIATVPLEKLSTGVLKMFYAVAKN